MLSIVVIVIKLRDIQAVCLFDAGVEALPKRPVSLGLHDAHSDANLLSVGDGLGCVPCKAVENEDELLLLVCLLGNAVDHRPVGTRAVGR